MILATSGLHVPARAMSRNVRPRYTSARHHPTAHRLAATLAPHLHLRTKFLVLGLRLQHGVSEATAMRAVSIARAHQD